VKAVTWTPAALPANEGLTIPAQVNYVGKGANLYRLGYVYHGSINVILDKVLAGPTVAEHESEFISPFAEGSAVIGTVLVEGLLEIHLDSLDGFPQDDSAGNRLAFAMLVCTAVNLVAGAEIDRVAILLDSADGLEAINVPVSDGDPPEEGAPVTCGNYVGFLADGLTDPDDPGRPSGS